MHYFATTFIARSFAAFFGSASTSKETFLSFFKRLVTIALNCAEMYENVIAAMKPKPFVALNHFTVPLLNVITSCFDAPSMLLFRSKYILAPCF